MWPNVIRSLAPGLPGAASTPEGIRHAAPAAAARPAADQSAGPASDFSGQVVSTMDAAGYTYIRVDTDGREIWAAANRFAVEEGDRVRRGQVLAALVRDDAKIALKKAQLKAKNARLAYERDGLIWVLDLESRKERELVAGSSPSWSPRPTP